MILQVRKDDLSLIFLLRALLAAKWTQREIPSLRQLGLHRSSARRLRRPRGGAVTFDRLTRLVNYPAQSYARSGRYGRNTRTGTASILASWPLRRLRQKKLRKSVACVACDELSSPELV